MAPRSATIASASGSCRQRAAHRLHDCGKIASRVLSGQVGPHELWLAVPPLQEVSVIAAVLEHAPVHTLEELAEIPSVHDRHAIPRSRFASMSEPTSCSRSSALASSSAAVRRGGATGPILNASSFQNL